MNTARQEIEFRSSQDSRKIAKGTARVSVKVLASLNAELA
jgi:hypothetical protein